MNVHTQSTHGSYAPILLFVYNRPLHTRQAVESLMNNAIAKETDLFIYSDAAKKETDHDNVAKVREYIHGITGFASITITERQENYGLARNIIEGVTDVE